MGDLNIQWYPGHMTKTRREIEAQLKFVDMVAEVVDARIPLASRNPDIDSIAAAKPRLLILNKSDLADPAATKRWISYWNRRGCGAIATDARGGNGVEVFKNAALSQLADKLARQREKGMKKTVKVMICGIPNVGKSAFINRLAGARKTKVEDRPGVTRGRQWISVDDELEVMDTAGVLWPKFNDKKAAMYLAFTGAVRDNVMDMEGLAFNLIEYLNSVRPDAFAQRYGVSCEGRQTLEIFDEICRKRGMLISRGEPDYARCAAMLLDEFRAGKLGRITLEYPPENRQ